MSLPGSSLRYRRSTLFEKVQEFDAFTKTVDEVKEEKKTAGGIISGLCFITISILVVGELNAYFYGTSEFDYKIKVDTAYDEHPELEIDIIVATPCTSLIAQSSDRLSNPLDLSNEFKRDPTRFEFTEKELMYWNELKRSQRRAEKGGSILKGLNDMSFISRQVETGLKEVAEEKRLEEQYAIEQERARNPDEETHGAAVFIIGNGVNVFHIVSSNSQKDEGTACRVHGSVQVNKVKGDSVMISVGKGTGIEGLLLHVGGHPVGGNTSHRIERLNFGPRIPGLVTPLAGTEQISASGVDEFHYFLKIVPTRIYHSGLFGGSTLTYQYSVTFKKKTSKPDTHTHPAILIRYEFSAAVIEVRQIHMSLIQLLVRICSVVGGVFGTSSIVNSFVGSALCFLKPKPVKHHRLEPVGDDQSLNLAGTSEANEYRPSKSSS
ncbi:hypothetical protein AB6A40_007227 [Gnathostoma spinigerum]|uniref:Uncharacterized protein n=1 Tax=Gnathostoma spinigerum TaxID=75299 RepID=A0ABD6ETZ9_9BILA